MFSLQFEAYQYILYIKVIEEYILDIAYIGNLFL